MAGRLDEARAEVEQALTLAREHGERGNEAYALRLRGAIVGRGDGADHDEAERSYREAMALATELGMRPLVALCHRELGMQYQRAGKHAQSREHLEEATTMYRDLAMTDQV